MEWKLATVGLFIDYPVTLLLLGEIIGMETIIFIFANYLWFASPIGRNYWNGNYLQTTSDHELNKQLLLLGEIIGMETHFSKGLLQPPERSFSYWEKLLEWKHLSGHYNEGLAQEGLLLLGEIIGMETF